MDMHVCERGGGWGGVRYMLLTASKCLLELHLQVGPLIRYCTLQFVTAGTRGMATQQQLLQGHCKGLGLCITSGNAKSAEPHLAQISPDIHEDVVQVDDRLSILPRPDVTSLQGRLCH